MSQLLARLAGGGGSTLEGIEEHAAHSRRRSTAGISLETLKRRAEGDFVLFMIFLTLDAERLELRGFIIKLLLDSIPLRIQSMLKRRLLGLSLPVSDLKTKQPANNPDTNGYIQGYINWHHRTFSG